LCARKRCETTKKKKEKHVNAIATFFKIFYKIKIINDQFVKCPVIETKKNHKQKNKHKLFYKYSKNYIIVVSTVGTSNDVRNVLTGSKILVIVELTLIIRVTAGTGSKRFRQMENNFRPHHQN
jgi:hypothetical protein